MLIVIKELIGFYVLEINLFISLVILYFRSYSNDLARLVEIKSIC